MFYLILSDYVLSEIEKEFITANEGFYEEFTDSVIVFGMTADLVIKFREEFEIEGGVSNV